MDELEITKGHSVFRGALLMPPRVGSSLLIYRIAEHDVLTTSVVRSVSIGPDGGLCVITLNSTYHLARTAAHPAVNEAA